MKNKRIIYFFTILFLCIAYTCFVEFYAGKNANRNNIVSAPQISSIKEVIAEKTDESKVTKYSVVSVTSTQAVTTHTVSVIPPVTTTVSTTTEAVTVVSVDSTVTEPEIIQEQTDIIIDTPPENPPQQQQAPSEPEPAPQEPIQEPEPVVQYAPSATEFQSEVLRIVNSYRRDAGIPEMSSTDILNQAAQIRAEEISGTFSHSRPDNSSCFTVLDDLGIYSCSKAENIAAGSDTPEDVVSQWMDSPGHRSNIMNPSYTAMGVGFCTINDDYKYYWAQMFIG